MQVLNAQDLGQITGGEGDVGKVCGAAVGTVIGATLLFGGVGFLATINKALVVCYLDSKN